MLTETEVLEFMQRWQEASDSEDFTQVAPLIHPSAVFRFNDGDHVGLAAIRDAFEQTWALDAGDSEEYVVDEVRAVHLGQDSATVTFGWRWRGAWDGEPFEVGGRGTSVIVRDGEGLRLILEHLGRD